MNVDYVIVGAGLSGAVIARELFDAGREVMVVDRRPWIGGNVRDDMLPCGIRYNYYGPHYFRTNDHRLWDYVHRFTDMRRWEARVQTSIGGSLRRWPLRTVDQHLKKDAIDHYNRKMWGRVPPQEAVNRIETRADDTDDRLTTHKYQGLPRDGYTAMVEAMLKDIPIRLGIDWTIAREPVPRKLLIFTGSIDQLFGYRLGRLRYRGQQRETMSFSGQHQPVVQVNYPHPSVRHIRSIEWNHTMEEPSWWFGSMVTKETPIEAVSLDQREYPVGDSANQRLHKAYTELLDDHTIVCGRLGRYRYLDMDQAIAAARVTAETILCEWQ